MKPLAFNSISRKSLVRAVYVQNPGSIVLQICMPETLAPLQIELWQEGDHGDLNIGTTEVNLGPLAKVGTIVKWFNLRDSENETTADLCLVMRHAFGKTN